MSCPLEEYQTLRSVSGAAASLCRSDTALKQSRAQTNSSALSALLASSHQAPGTSDSSGLCEEKPWDKAVGDTQLDPETKLNPDPPLSSEQEVLQHDRRGCYC